MHDRQRHVLGLVFLTVLVDMIGFSIIFPLFPDLLAYYVRLEGSQSVVGRLAAQLAQMVKDEFAVVALFGGVLGSLYSLLQFLFAPVWGSVSDRVGRRPTLLVTLAGTALSYLLWFVSGTFAVLVLARLVGGIMAGNIATASAAVADTCEGPERAKGMGVLGAGIGLGMVIGPAIGGLAHLWNPLDTWPQAATFGVNPFSACALAALGLASFNFVWALSHFPETHSESQRHTSGATEGARTMNPFGALRRLDYRGVPAANLCYFLYFTAFTAMEFTLTFLAVQRLDYHPTDNMWMFVFVGLTIALVQGGVLRKLTPRMSEKHIATFGIGLTLPGLALVGAAHSSWALYAGLAFLAVGSALVMPCLGALVSRYTPADRQGLAMGVFRSLGALARAIGPFLGGLLYWRMGSAAPYFVGAALLIVPLAMCASLPPVPDE
jgi:MFS family permease